MKTSDIQDPIFLLSVKALDEGRLDDLRQLVEQHPYLVRDRLNTPNEEGYFKAPYLLWFVADNPVRNERLPDNALETLNFLIDAVKRESPDTFKQQIDYALGLIATGRTPRESGQQIAMMDALIDAGATPGGGMGAIAHGNIEAANHLIDRGGKLSFAAAMILDRQADVDQLFNSASDNEKLTALTAAAFYGKTDQLKFLLGKGVPPNGYPDKGQGFHSHATPLHQAVYSGSLEVIRMLVEAGARLDITDKVYNGTPLGWAIYAQTETDNETEKIKYREIADYLKEKSG